MFQAVGDIVTMKWVREHPIVTTSVAAAAAVYSYAQFGNNEETEIPQEVEQRWEDGDQSKDNSPTSSSNNSKISWGDDNGGKLATVLQDEKVRQKLLKTVSQKNEDEDGVKLEPKCLKVQNTFERQGSNLSTISSDDEFETNGTTSPQWGWFVTFTPPQNPMYGTESGAIQEGEHNFDSEHPQQEN